MALPELTLPDGTPIFLASGHAIDLTPMYADIPMRTGHDRRRRVFTTVPRGVSVSLLLSQAQMTAFHNWFEGPLKAGSEWFSTRVKNQGPGLLWWKARFIDTYAAEALHSRFWRVTAKLLLTGIGSVNGPYNRALVANTTIALTGTAVLTLPLNLSADTVIALLSNIPMSADTVIALRSSEYELREDGSFILREDGSFVVRE